MSLRDEILQYNATFVTGKKYEPFLTTKYPDKHIAILSCMDTRLTALLPAALNFRNGDVKLIKNAGGMISHPFGSVMRSLLVAVYKLGVNEILVIGHYDCGMQNIDPMKLIETMKARGVRQEALDFIEFCGIDMHKWLHGFDDPQLSVCESVRIIREHPLMPADIEVSGYLMDPETGRLDPLD